jgi:hypothetical protein
VRPNRELILEDARSIRDWLWRMARYAQDAGRGAERYATEYAVLSGVVV